MHPTKQQTTTTNQSTTPIELFKFIPNNVSSPLLQSDVFTLAISLAIIALTDMKE